MGKQWQANGPWSETIQRKKWRARCAELDTAYPHLWPSNFGQITLGRSFARLGTSAELAADAIIGLREAFRRMNEQIAWRNVSIQVSVIPANEDIPNE